MCTPDTSNERANMLIYYIYAGVMRNNILPINKLTY